MKKAFLLFSCLISIVYFSFSATISGTVTDCNSGIPITGVTILVQGTAMGVSTDVNGNYSLSGLAPGQSYTLEASFVGYATKESVVDVPTEGTYPQNIEMGSPSVNPQSDIVVNPGETIGPINFTTTPTGGTINWSNDNTAIGLIANGSGNITAYTAPSNTTGSPIVATITVNATLSGCTSTSPEIFTITINPDPYVVVNTNDTGISSLRWCLNNANANPGQTITFNIPGLGPHVIQPASPLPTITQPLNIDGYSQPGSSKNTLNNAIDANIEIVLDGSNLGSGSGLDIQADNTTISGLSIVYFPDHGIEVNNASAVNIQGNFIGVPASGDLDEPNSRYGILLNNSNGCTIGGNAPEFRNIITSNSLGEIYVQGNGSTGNVISGNIIGLDITGTNAQAVNNPFGITIDNASGNTIGGASIQERNVISDHTDGIIIQGANASGNQILGNYLGTDVYGTANVKNHSTGIYIHSDANSNTIGSTNANEGNTIANSDNHNILIDGSNTNQNSIRGNTINCSVNGENIFLQSSGNNNKSIPTIEYVHPDSISGTAQANDIIDLYFDYSGCTPKGASEFAVSVTADGSGFWYYNTSGTFNSFDEIVAIATDANGNSSQFSDRAQIPFAILSGTLALDNSYVDVELSGAGWGDASTTNPLDASDFNIDLTLNGSAQVNDVTITGATQTDGTALAGGESIIRLNLNVDGYPNGDEEISINAVASSIFDEGGVAMGSDQDTGPLALNATPVITNSTTNFSICSGETTSIDIEVSQTSTLNWTAVASSGNLTGFSSSGTVDPITETIDNSGNTLETVTYTVIPTNGDGLEGEPQDFVVEVKPLPDVIANPASATICSGGQTNIALSSNTSPLTVFTWTSIASSGVTGNFNSGGENILDQLNNSNTSDGTVTYTITPTLNGCTGNSLDVVVTVKAQTAAQFSSVDQSVCNEVNEAQLDVELEGSGPWDVTLTDGNTDYPPPNGEITFSPFTFENLDLPNENTTFTIKEAINKEGGISCPMTITGNDVTVTRAQAVSATIDSNDTTFCENTNNIQIPVSFTGIGPWDLDYLYGGSISTQTFNSRNGFLTINLSSGTQPLNLVSVSDQSLPACTGTANSSIEITQIDAPTAILSLAEGANSKTICNGDEVEFQIEFTGSPELEFELTIGSNTETRSIPETATSPFTFTETINSDQDVVYSLNSIKSTAPECLGSASGAVTLNILPLPGQPPTTAISGASEVCQGATTETFTAATIANADEYEWSLSDGLSFSSGSPTNEATVEIDVANDINSATITVAGKNACGTGPTSSPFNISVNSIAGDPGDINGPVEVCQGSSDITYTITSVDDAQEYVWQLDYNNDANDQSIETTQPEVQLDFPQGFQEMTLSVAGLNACGTSQNTSDITINPLAIPGRATQVEGPEEVCEGEEFTVSVSEIDDATEYIWQLPQDIEPASGDNVTSSNSIILLGPATSNLYSINVRGNNKCGEGLPSKNPLRTSSQIAPVARIEAESSTYLGQETLFTGINESPEQNIARWDWELGDGSTNFGQEITHKYQDDGSFTVTLEIINDANCSANASTEIEVINELPVTIMNVITPNGDGKNDGVIIDGVELFPNNEIVLLNRMGVEIARFENYKNNWNSLYNGSPLQPGNYVCIFKITGTDLLKKQTISVLKD